MKLVCEQRFLGPKSFFACVMLIDLLQVITLDMYTPALPSMQRAFGVSAAYLNQTVFMFLVASAVAMMFSGSVADHFGRKPVIVLGAALFTTSSVVCALASSIGVLIVFRCGQAIGWGVSSTVCPALLKDAYDDESLKLTLSLMQSLVLIGPVVAPFLGSLMLGLMDWRGIFVFLAGAGLLTLALAALVTETLPEELKSHESARATLRSMAGGGAQLAKSRGFLSLSLFMAVGGMPFFAFIAVSSYILLDEFGLGYLQFSWVYAIACTVNMVAPYVYLVLSRHLRMTAIAWVTVALSVASAAAMAAFAHLGAAVLLVAFVPYALAEGIIRPAAYVGLLDQPQQLVGTASAISSFAYSILTALATVFATLPWPTFLTGQIAIMAAAGALLLAIAAAGSRNW